MANENDILNPPPIKPPQFNARNNEMEESGIPPFRSSMGGGAAQQRAPQPSNAPASQEQGQKGEMGFLEGLREAKRRDPGRYWQAMAMFAGGAKSEDWNKFYGDEADREMSKDTLEAREAYTREARAARLQAAELKAKEREEYRASVAQVKTNDAIGKLQRYGNSGKVKDAYNQYEAFKLSQDPEWVFSLADQGEAIQFVGALETQFAEEETFREKVQENSELGASSAGLLAKRNLKDPEGADDRTQWVASVDEFHKSDQAAKMAKVEQARKLAEISIERSELAMSIARKTYPRMDATEQDEYDLLVKELGFANSRLTAVLSKWTSSANAPLRGLGMTKAGQIWASAEQDVAVARAEVESITEKIAAFNTRIDAKLGREDDARVEDNPTSKDEVLGDKSFGAFQSKFLEKK